MDEDGRSPVAPIPRAWRDAVRAILHARYSKTIRPTQRAQDEWVMTFPESYIGELYEILEKTLADDALLGRCVQGLTPPGEAYEFFLHFNHRKIYAKLNLLLPQRSVVVIVSAHPPYKGNDL